MRVCGNACVSVCDLDEWVSVCGCVGVQEVEVAIEVEQQQQQKQCHTNVARKAEAEGPLRHNAHIDTSVRLANLATGSSLSSSATILNLQSTIRNPQSAIRNPDSGLWTPPQSTIRTVTQWQQSNQLVIS